MNKPIAYQVIYQRLLSTCKEKVIERKFFLEMLAEIYRFPKESRVKIMLEMQDLKLIKQIDRDKLKIL